MSFFFQAEDGIRDIGVTGVQTCALPIYLGRANTAREREAVRASEIRVRCHNCGRRSEERRVGKECRWPLSLCDFKKIPDPTHVKLLRVVKDSKERQL